MLLNFSSIISDMISDSPGGLVEAFKGIFSEKELIANIKKHCTDVFDCEGGANTTYYSLDLSPVAAAIVMRDAERLQLFFEHAAPQAVIPQIKKLRFVAKWLPVFIPEHDATYRILGDMVDDYARGNATQEGEILDC